MKKKFILFPILLLLFIFCSRNSAILAQEKAESVKLKAKNQSDRIDFYIENPMFYEITITIDFPVLKNLKSGVKLPYTETIFPGTSPTLFSLYIIDKDILWKYKYKYNYMAGSIYAEHDDRYIYSLPYASGTSHKVTQGFNGTFSHSGEEQYAIDWAMPEGTSVCAAREGTVIATKDIYSKGGTDQKYKKLANYILIRHSDGTIGEYFHLKNYGIYVSPGQKVKTGDIIGLSGNTGYSTGPHLHFAVYKAADGRTRKTIPIKFRTLNSEGTVLKEKTYYKAP